MSRVNLYHRFLENLYRQMRESPDRGLRVFCQEGATWPMPWLLSCQHNPPAHVVTGFHRQPFFEGHGDPEIKLLSIEIGLGQFRGRMPPSLATSTSFRRCEARNCLYIAIEVNLDGESPEVATRHRWDELMRWCLENLREIDRLLGD